MANAPLIAIVGPTASGKTALAIKLAQQFNGEIIAADSRTVYKGMDIGTAKPTAAEQALVPHHLLDVVTPDEPFTVADFKKLAQAAIQDIAARGKLPILVGGSGLYVDAVLFNYSFSPSGSGRDTVNPRHASKGTTHTRQPLREHTLVLGLTAPREVLKQNIEARTKAMMSDGFIEEARQLHEQYGEVKALLTPGYTAAVAYMQGASSLEEVEQQFARNDSQLARRQLTWFRRNKSIQWVSDLSQVVDLVTTFLNKKQ